MLRRLLVGLWGRMGRRERRGALVLAGLVVALAAVGRLALGVSLADVGGIITPEYVAAALRLTVALAFAAIGGIFAEKTGVINIGLEGLLIFSAFSSVAVAFFLIEAGVSGGFALWIGFFAAVGVSVLVSLAFAAICIDYRANQIIAGLAIWLVALGFAPFASRIIWESVNSPSVGRFETWTVPVLADIPVVGSILFDANPTIYMLLVAVPLAWYLLNMTDVGNWMKACGENPKALDTAGVDVRRVRYTGVTLSGLFSGIGGAGLAIGQVGSFVGVGMTMVNGRGWIAITAFLFGNYSVGRTFVAALLFGGLDALQIRLQQIPGYGVPDPLIRVLPFVIIIVVLALVGKTRIPSAAGEPYDPGEE